MRRTKRLETFLEEDTKETLTMPAIWEDSMSTNMICSNKTSSSSTTLLILFNYISLQLVFKEIQVLSFHHQQHCQQFSLL